MFVNGTTTSWMAKGSGAPVRSLSADGNGVQAVLELLDSLSQTSSKALAS